MTISQRLRLSSLLNVALVALFILISFSLLIRFQEIRKTTINVEQGVEQQMRDLVQTLHEGTEKPSEMAEIHERISTMLQGSLLARDQEMSIERQFTIIVSILVFLITVVASGTYSMSASISEALNRLEESTKFIVEGNYDHVLPVHQADEFGRFSHAFNQMTERVKEAKHLLEQRVRERTAELEEAYRQVWEKSDSAKKFQKAVEASTEGIVICDEDRNILYVNRAWEQQTGYRASEVFGKRTSLLKSQKTKSDVMEALERAINERREFHSRDIVNRRKDGSEYNAELTIYPARSEEEKGFIVGIQKDITSWKIADRMKSDFVSLASHQLRTPLTEIRWWLASLIQKSSMDPKTRTTIENAHRAAVGMAETIRAMLMITNLEAGEVHSDATKVSVNDVLTDTVLMLSGIRERRGVHLTVECPSDLSLETDERLLKEILSCLLSNAYKYTPQNGSIVLSGKRAGGNVTITVADTGYGIPVSEQSRIAEKFFRGSNVQSLKEAGTGLGLYLVYALSRIIGGSVSFVSTENAGTSFTLTLPA